MKLLVVGLGGIGQRHVRNLRRLLGDDLQLSAYRQRGRRQVLTERLKWIRLPMWRPRTA